MFKANLSFFQRERKKCITHSRRRRFCFRENWRGKKKRDRGRIRKKQHHEALKVNISFKAQKPLQTTFSAHMSVCPYVYHSSENCILLIFLYYLKNLSWYFIHESGIRIIGRTSQFASNSNFLIPTGIPALGRN